MTVVCAFFVGCAARQPGPGATNCRVDVFGAELGAAGTPLKLRGVAATEEPCLKGYERNFDTLGVSIGYAHNGKIRKITTRNPETAMFGIHPGDDVRSSRQSALVAGFTETGVANRLRGDRCMLTLLVGEDARVFGMTVELLD